MCVQIRFLHGVNLCNTFFFGMHFLIEASWLTIALPLFEIPHQVLWFQWHNIHAKPRVKILWTRHGHSRGKKLWSLGVPHYQMSQITRIHPRSVLLKALCRSYQGSWSIWLIYLKIIKWLTGRPRHHRRSLIECSILA